MQHPQMETSMEPQSEDERVRREEADRFKEQLELEQLIEMRVQHYSEENNQGVLGASVRVEDPQKGDKVFFVDAAQSVCQKMEKLWASTDKERLVKLQMLGYEERMATFCSFLEMTFRQKHKPQVSGIYQKLANLMLGKNGLCALLQDWLAETTRPEKLLRIRIAVEGVLRRMYKCAEKLVACTLGNTEELEYANRFLDFIQRLAFPLIPPCLLGCGQLPPVEPEDELEVMLRTPHPDIMLASMGYTDDRPVMTDKSWTVSTFTWLTVHVLNFPEDVELCGVLEHGETIKLQTDQTLEFACQRCSKNTIAVTGIDFVSDQMNQTCAADASKAGPPLVPSQSPGYEEIAKKWLLSGGKMIRTSAVTATCLLHELRSHYQEPTFHQQYQELRGRARRGDENQTKTIEMVFKVQSKVIPNYGFAPTPKGVNEMRMECGFHGDHRGGDKLVDKLIKDVHHLLETTRPLPRMPIARYTVPKRFEAVDKDGWLRHLADLGFAVIANVVSDSEVQHAYSLLWDFIEGADQDGKIKRSDVKTWKDAYEDASGWPAGKADGIIHSKGIGQSQVLWYLRSLPSLKKVFTDIWGTEELVTSFDGAGVFRPYGHNPLWKITKTNQGWCHVDQAHQKQGLHCVQGLVTLRDATECTGGLVVVPGSHRFYSSDVLRNYKPTSNGWNFIALDANDRVLTEGGGGPRMVCAKAGDLILWDSRTVHCNTPPLLEDMDVLCGNELIRAVAYICMTPAAWCSSQTLSKRSTAFEKGITTAHWPHEFYAMNTPETHIPSFTLTPEQQNMVSPQIQNLSPNRCTALLPGRISFFEEECFEVVSPNARIRHTPTTDWGSSITAWQVGDRVTGHVFGNWLRLSNPQLGKLATEEDAHESWALIEASLNGGDEGTGLLLKKVSK